MNRSADDDTREVSGEFPVTHWSAVVAAGVEGTPRAEAALAELCRTYWYPLYAFARRKGHQPADAQDLTQGFFAYLIEARLVEKAEREKGRFRSFLLACFVHFMASENERAQAYKRCGGHPIIPMDPQGVEERLGLVPSPELSPERLFDRYWALTVVDEALALLESESKKSGHSRLFEELQPFLQGDKAGASYTDVAQCLGTTEGTIRVTVHRLRQRYRELLRVVVNRTVHSPLEIEAELSSLMAALRS